MEGSRYKIVADFEDEIKSLYNIDFSDLLSSVVPKMTEDPELMSDSLIHFASQFANTFLKTLEVSGIDPPDSMPDNDQEIAQEIQGESSGATLPVPDEHTDEPQPDVTVNSFEQASTSRDKRHSLPKAKKLWSPADTELVESLFLPELLDSVARGSRVLKAAIKAKAQHPKFKAPVSTLIDKYGANSLYEKLYSFRRKQMKK